MSQMRVIQIRPNERLITVNREAGSRNVGYLCCHHHKILLIAAQSILRLASAINKLATSEVDKVSFQSLSLLVKGRIKVRQSQGVSYQASEPRRTASIVCRREEKRIQED